MSSPRQLDRAAAATQIQSLCRGYLQRRFYEKLQAVVAIQTVWRSYAARQTVESQLLPHSLYEEAIRDIEKRGLTFFPQARTGNKCVYLLDHVVIKQCGLAKCLDILTEISLARHVCKENGYQRICIPRGRIYRDALVVERLFFSSRPKAQMGLYLRYHTLFTEAVKEFAKFYFKTRTPDLVDGSKNPNSYKSLVPPSDFHLCRYDNLAMYIQYEQSGSIGKLGLIDVDGFSPKSEPLTLKRAYVKCRALIGMFPQHFTDIFKVAVRYDSRLFVQQMGLEIEQETVLACFGLAYTDHYEFAKRKGICLTGPAWFNTFTHKTWELQLELSDALERENTQGQFKGCLREESLTDFNKNRFSRLTFFIYNMISKGLTQRVKRYGPIQSMEELLDARTLRFDLSLYISKIYKIFPSLDMFNLKPEEKLPFLKKIIEFLLKRLEQHELIAKYIPEFGFPPHQMQCLFC